MTVYYYQNGFLHTDGTPPEGAVALTAAENRPRNIALLACIKI